jgi:hypothetical protein
MLRVMLTNDKTIAFISQSLIKKPTIQLKLNVWALYEGTNLNLKMKILLHGRIEVKLLRTKCIDSVFSVLSVRALKTRFFTTETRKSLDKFVITNPLVAP